MCPVCIAILGVRRESCVWQVQAVLVPLAGQPGLYCGAGHRLDTKH